MPDFMYTGQIGNSILCPVYDNHIRLITHAAAGTVYQLTVVNNEQRVCPSGTCVRELPPDPLGEC